jgi:hypothetical protein
LRNLAEQNVEVTDTLLNVPNLLLALDDESFLEVYLILGCQVRHFLPL